MITTPKHNVLAILRKTGMLSMGPDPELRPISDQASGNAWVYMSRDGQFCVQQTSDHPKVQDRWMSAEMPLSAHAEWIKTVAHLAPANVPLLIDHCPRNNVFVQKHYPEEIYPRWDWLIEAGKASVETARLIALRLSYIHQMTRYSSELSRHFSFDRIFMEQRIEPLILRNASRYPALAKPIKQLAKMTAGRKMAVIHGDFCPRNVLIGPTEPLFINAVTANYGDPAFDLAFCLHHLWCKSAKITRHTKKIRTLFHAFLEAYSDQLSAEERQEFLSRSAQLMAVFLLAYVNSSTAVRELAAGDLNLLHDLAFGLFEHHEHGFSWLNEAV